MPDNLPPDQIPPAIADAQSVEQYTGLDAELYDVDYADYNTGDIEFYVEEAVKCGSTVLELACGTGRITFPIAEAGVEVVGVELSPDMLAVAERKVKTIPADIARKITLVQGDMRDFQLDRKFDLVLIPFRAFICLMTVEDQKQALQNVMKHLSPNGRLILNFYDPDLREILDQNERLSNVQQLMNSFVHPVSGHQVKEWSTWDCNITEQIIEEFRNYVEYDSDGSILKSTLVTLRVRYIFRWEMHHLLELCGFNVDALYGDFNRNAFRARGEQIWVASRAGE